MQRAITSISPHSVTARPQCAAVHPGGRASFEVLGHECRAPGRRMDQDLLYRRRYYFTPPNADNASTSVPPFALWSVAVCNRHFHLREI